MTSGYRNTICVVYLLFCLFITSLSAPSIIRQFTDDLNTNLQQQVGAEPIQNRDKAQYLGNGQQISSRDYKVLASSTVKGLRDRRPSSYSLKMESFNRLLKSTYAERYESRPFSAGGYNWTLVVYPNGNKKDSGSGYLSLYVAIDNSTLFASAHKEVYADLRFYIFNKNERKYFTIQDTDVWRFNAFKTMWGFSQVLPVDTFKAPSSGYLYDGDHCEFGVDVTIPTAFEKSELFSVIDYFPNPIFTWKIREFSTLHKEQYYSDEFTIGEKRWKLRVHPSGHATGKGNALSMYLFISAGQMSGPFERVYVRAKLRALNQGQFNNIEMQFDNWFEPTSSYGLGWHQFIPFSDLKNPSKGFLVNDMLMVQLEMEAISSTKYFPS